MGSWSLGQKRKARVIKEAISENVPLLEERRKEKAGNLSGGQRQMISTSKGPSDSPPNVLLARRAFSWSITNLAIDDVFKTIKEINLRRGLNSLS